MTGKPQDRSVLDQSCGLLTTARNYLWLSWAAKALNGCGRCRLQSGERRRVGAAGDEYDLDAPELRALVIRRLTGSLPYGSIAERHGRVGLIGTGIHHLYPAQVERRAYTLSGTQYRGGVVDALSVECPDILVVVPMPDEDHPRVRIRAEL